MDTKKKRFDRFAGDEDVVVISRGVGSSKPDYAKDVKKPSPNN